MILEAKIWIQDVCQAMFPLEYPGETAPASSGFQELTL